MDVISNVKPHGALMQLYDQISNHESWLLSPDLLQSLGIHATQVTLTSDGNLAFEPCFFRPHPEKLIPFCYFNQIRDKEDHPDTRVSNTLPENPFPDNPLPSNRQPTFETILQETQKNMPDGDYLKEANLRYEHQIYLWSFEEENIHDQAEELARHIDYYLDMELEDQSEDSRTLYNLEGLECCK